MLEEQLSTRTRVTAMAATLRSRILAGSLSPGDLMPSVRQLARSSSVSVFTAARVYEVLVAEGMVDARRGAGYFVSRSSTLLKSEASPAPEPAADSLWALRRGYDPLRINVDAGCGWLPPQWLFAEGVRSALAEVARRPAAYAGRYGSAQGLRTLRRHLAARLMQRSIECTERQVVLTQGASQALELSISVLTRPGDCALVDDPCYPHLLTMLRARGIRPIGVPRTASGPDPRALESLAIAHQPRVFITNSTLHNPTGTTTSLQVAHDVLLTARQLGFLVVEDDVFGELAPDRTTCLAALDHLRRVVHVGSFSKTIAPNLRVGYLVADVELAQRIAAQKSIFSLCSSELTEQIVLSILTAGRHRTHLERLRARLASANERVARRLAAVGVEIAFRGSGPFLWGRLPTALDSAVVMQLAQARGILLAPGDIFGADGAPSPFYRFNVAFADSDPLCDFIASLPRA